MKPQLIVGWVLLVLLALNRPAFAETKYTVLVQDYPSLPPYSSYQDADYQGFNRELLDLFAAHRGYTFDYVALPVKRLHFEFSSGAGDLKYPDNPKWALSVKKDAKIVYSDPVVNYVNGVMVRPEDKGKPVDRIQSLGLVAGWTAIGYQESIEAGDVKLAENNDYAGLLKQTMFGRNDGAYSNVATSQYYLKNVLKKPGGLVFDESIPHVRATRHLASVNRPELIEEFNAFLKSHGDQIESLKQKYAVEDGIPTN
ncbi:hypothetical protein [Hoeflea sp.]|uniref:hypothetical protein n=1 Tax=Hoeflea sp. TaxID=1940281 RepID=UPI003B014A29